MDTTKVVTKIEELDKKRSKVFVNHEFAFVLYKGEIKQYKVKTEEILEENSYCEIVNNILPKRAKKRCLNLLQKRPYTENKLREKLEEGFYPKEIIEDAINYVKSFHYIDDYDFACQYIFYHKSTESRRKMEEKLSLKGVTKEVLSRAFQDSYCEEEEQELELEQVKRLLEKKKYDAQSTDWKEKQKIYAFLVRKGFNSSTIRKALSINIIQIV